VIVFSYTESTSESGDLATMFFCFFCVREGREMMLPGGVAVNSVQFEMDSWTGAHRAFAVKLFYKNNDSYVAAQREFRKKFGVYRNSKVPSAHAIKTWVQLAQLLRRKVVVLKRFAPHRTLTP
jgi:hypothetical protein